MRRFLQHPCQRQHVSVKNSMSRKAEKSRTAPNEAEARRGGETTLLAELWNRTFLFFSSKTRRIGAVRSSHLRFYMALSIHRRLFVT